MKCFGAFWLLAAVLAVSCAPAASSRAVDPLAGRYTGGGGGGAIATVQALSARFSQLHPGVHLELQNLSSDIGVDLVSKGQLDFGFVSRDLKPAEKTAVATLPIGVVGSALAVNASNPVTNLTRGGARKLLTGEFRDWAIVGGPAGHAPLVVIREPEAATRTALEAWVFEPSMRPFYWKDALLTTSIDQTLDALHDNPDAVAMVTVNQRTLSDAKIRLVALDAVVPSMDSLNKGTYPVRRPLFIVHDPDTSKLKPAIRAFFEFVKSPEGQQIIASS